MIRAAGYCRVSTDRDDQANSFDAQQRYFREYIERQPEWELYEIYADEGITGTCTQKRARFNAMIRDARLGKFSLILTKEVSRFSRNILDTIAFTRELKSLGVEVIFLTDGIRTMDPDAELRLSIMASIAQEESRKTSARVKWGQMRQMERGVVFGHSLLGYDVHGGVMTVNPDGAELVRLIFHKYAAEKKGTSVIARELTEAGARTVTGNTQWSAGHILKILKNEKYIGDLVQKKTCTPDFLTHEKKPNRGTENMVILHDHHPPIVSRELWDAAQSELAARSRHTGGHSVRYPLSGKIRCGVCGSSFISRQKKRSDGTSWRRWGCIRSSDGRGCMVGHMLRDDCAMEMLRIALGSIDFDREAFLDGITGEICGGMHDGIPQLTRSLEKLRQKRDMAVDEYLSGNLTKAELDAVRERYSREENALNRRLAEQKEEPMTEDSMTKRAAEIMNGRTDSAAFWQNVVDTITVHRSGAVEICLTGLETRWTFALGEG